MTPAEHAACPGRQVTSYIDAAVLEDTRNTVIALRGHAVKGARLIVAGELTVAEYTDRDGATRTRRRITAQHAGLSTRFHSARSTKPVRQSDDALAG